MEIQDIMRELAKEGISTSIHYDSERKQCYVDLETKAKSKLYLYEDGILRGRYDYEKQIDLNKQIDDLITELCQEFNRALHGRNYYQQAWADLCRRKNIVLETYGI